MQVALPLPPRHERHRACSTQPLGCPRRAMQIKIFCEQKIFARRISTILTKSSAQDGVGV